YVWAFEQIVPPLVERFRPDVLVSQLGVDTHYLDPLARMALTTAAHQPLFRALDGLAPGGLAVGGGGYAIAAVPRAWPLAFAVMARQALPAMLPPQYRARCGGRAFRDLDAPDWTQYAAGRAEEDVEEVVAAVSQQHDF